MVEVLAEPEVDISLAEALPILAKLAGAGVLYGVCIEADAFARAFFGVGKAAVGWIPFAGELLSAGLGTIEQNITGYLGDAEAELDAEMGASLHTLAHTGDVLLAQLTQLGLLEDAIAERVAHAVEHAAGVTASTVVRDARTVVDRTTVDVIHEGDAVGVSALHETVSALTARVGTLEHDWQGVLDPTVEELRERTKAIEDGFTHAWDLLKEHSEALGIGAITSTVAVALEQLGADWIRCGGTGAVGRALCGLGPAILDDLLAGALDIAGLYELCNIVTLLTDAASGGEVQSVLGEIVDGIDDLTRCRKLKPAAGLKQTLYALPGPVTAMAAAGVAG